MNGPFGGAPVGLAAADADAEEDACALGEGDGLLAVDVEPQAATAIMATSDTAARFMYGIPSGPHHGQLLHVRPVRP